MRRLTSKIATCKHTKGFRDVFVLIEIRTRLTDLDLGGNRLVKVTGLHQLRALKHLHLGKQHPILKRLKVIGLILILGNNKLSNFATSPSLPHLETLDLASNSLSTINLNPLPNLRTLDIDQNSISHLPSLSTLRQLHTLSWRSQSLSPGSEINYQSCHNLTNLYLSGNTLSSFTFHPDTDPFFNLQVLELASTGLKILPEGFGLQCPNLRTLNLNFNAIRDLRPLLGITRLERLYLAGNRIERLRRTAAVLERVGKELREVDTRGCPLTVGFYVPPSQSQYQSDESAEKRIILSDSNPDLTSADDQASGWTEEPQEKRAAQAYLLPLVDRGRDKADRERLDEDTKIRRRVYEMLLVSACPRLKALDGLEVCKGDVVRKDGTWGRLCELGVLRPRVDGGERKMIEASGLGSCDGVGPF